MTAGEPLRITALVWRAGARINGVTYLTGKPVITGIPVSFPEVHLDNVYDQKSP